MIKIFIPVFNEEASLKTLLEAIIFELKASNLQFSVLVVDDGSTDSTPEILSEFETNGLVEVITHKYNRGLGDAERTGFEYLAEHSDLDDIIVRVEGDDTHGINYIFDIVNKIHEGFDVVNTSRFQKGGGQIGITRYRAFISYCANIFMKIILRINNVYDFSCGYRGYRAEILKDAFAIYGKDFLQLRGLGFTATLEIIIKLKLLGCSFAEVPFVLRYDKKKSSSKMVSSITTFGYLVMAVLYHWPFGGWRVGYNKIRKNYKKNRVEVVRTNLKKGFERFFYSSK